MRGTNRHCSRIQCSFKSLAEFQPRSLGRLCRIHTTRRRRERSPHRQQPLARASKLRAYFCRRQPREQLERARTRFATSWSQPTSRSRKSEHRNDDRSAPLSASPASPSPTSSTARCSASTNAGSVIRGFIVSGSNSTPSVHSTQRSAQPRAKKRKPRVRPRSSSRARQLERPAAAPSPRRPTDQLAAHERKKIAAVELARFPARSTAPAAASRECTARPNSATER